MRALALVVVAGCGVPDTPCNVALQSSTAPGSTTPAQTACSIAVAGSTLTVDGSPAGFVSASVGIAWNGAARTIRADDPGVTTFGTIARDDDARWIVLAGAGRFIVTFVSETPDDNAHGVVDAELEPVVLSHATGTYVLHATF